jgi:hypothetical protein
MIVFQFSTSNLACRAPNAHGLITANSVDTQPVR